MKFNKLQAYLNNFFWLFLTYLLSPIFYFLIFLRSKVRTGEKLKILVIQTAKIGDLVCATPVFREIKKKFPSCHLTAMVTSQTKDVLRNNPWINEIILITDYQGFSGRFKLLNKLRKSRYDWIFNVLPGSFDNIISFWLLAPHRVTTTHKYSGETAALTSVFSNHRLEYKRGDFITKHFLNLLKFIGIEEFSDEKEVFSGQEEEKLAINFLSENNLNSDDLLIAIHVVAGVKVKEWQPDQFAKLADLLIEKLEAKVIFVGSGNDKEVIGKIQKMMQNSSLDASGYFKLNELPAFFKKMKLFIGADSGPLHIADAAGAPLVIIAGPVHIPSQANPTRSRFKIVQKRIYCAPCLFAVSAPYFCSEGHLRCLKEITSEEVLDAAVSLIKTK